MRRSGVRFPQAARREGPQFTACELRFFLFWFRWWSCWAVVQRSLGGSESQVAAHRLRQLTGPVATVEVVQTSSVASEEGLVREESAAQAPGDFLAVSGKSVVLSH